MPAKPTADSYAEITLSRFPGTVSTGFRFSILPLIAKNDGQLYDQSNDYSYNGSAERIPTNHVTAYVKGATVQPLRTGKPATADFGAIFDANTLASATTTDRGILLDEADRAQGDEVGRVLVEVLLEGIRLRIHGAESIAPVYAFLRSTKRGKR